jgi:hypothetical protein
MSCPHLSSYAKQLPLDVLIRYKEKLEMIDNVDPFQIKDSELSLNKNDYPKTQIVDIYMYFIESKSPYTREEIKAHKSLQAFKYYESGFVKYVGTKQFGKFVMIKGVVRRSYKKTEFVKCWLISEKDGTVRSAHCICAAGLGEFCSHTAAVLFKILDELKTSNVSLSLL